MAQEKVNYDRKLAAGLHESGEASTLVVQFFADCLKQGHYGYADDVEQELLTLRKIIDDLLSVNAVESGFFRLETEHLQITVWVSFAVPIAEHDLGVPSLSLLGELPVDAVLTLVIAGEPHMPVPSSIIQRLRAYKGHRMQLKIEIANQPEPNKEKRGEALPELRATIHTLGLSPDTVEANAQEIAANVATWEEQKKLVAHTIVIKPLRVIVGRVNLSERLDVVKIRSHLERVKAADYKLGVLLLPHATPSQRWLADQTGYRDFVVGDVPNEQLHQVLHFLFNPKE